MRGVRVSRVRVDWRVSGGKVSEVGGGVKVEGE